MAEGPHTQSGLDVVLAREENANYDEVSIDPPENLLMIKGHWGQYVGKPRASCFSLP